MSNYRSFHPYIADAYSAVHQWLETKEQAKGYKTLTSYKQCQGETLKSAAAQYYLYFPAHYFKAIHTLDTVITPTKLLTWLDHNPHLCFVDIGCGAGAGSLAFVETILRLREQECFTHPVDIFCLGIDRNQYTFSIYNQLITQVKQHLSLLNINLEHKGIPKGVQEASLDIRLRLQQKREQWQQPFLSHVVMMHSTVVDLLRHQHERQLAAYKVLQEELDIDSDFISNNFTEYSKQYALDYQQFLEAVPIDYLSILTIGTDKDSQSVTEMGEVLKQVFSSNDHQVVQLGEGFHQVRYENPQGSYWRDKGCEPHTHQSDFCVDVSTITSAKLHEDNDWNELISLENIELAWVHARKYFFQESFLDEVEIRLFERNLHENLTRLQKQLIAYVQEVAHQEDYLPYKFIKDLSKTRPRALLKIEEEILSVAIVQKLGKKAYLQLQSNSYAYRLPTGNNSTEFLYQNWFTTYRNFINHAIKSSQNYDNAVIVHVDIESYYMKILQNRLIDLTAKELTESTRIRWLLKILLSKELNEHEVGCGLTQGSIGSGFYANIYLKPIDILFGSQPDDNEWGVNFSRYLDDMILIIPDSSDVHDVLDILKDELKKIGLNLNEDKTEIYTETPDFIEAFKEDDLLETLSQDFKNIINLLYITDFIYRKEFATAYKNNSDDFWWYFIEQYQKCLQSLSIYISTPDLSRKIYEYLFNIRWRNENLKSQKELNFPAFPYWDKTNDETGTEFLNWAICFQTINLDWIYQKKELKSRLINLFTSSWIEFNALEFIPDKNEKIKRKRKLKTYIRFAFSKLSLLGLAEIKKEVVDILCGAIWIFREPLQVVENLARQGHETAILEVISYYQYHRCQMSEYIRSVTLRAIRFLPNINADVWEKMVEYATRSSLVERLMATETWLSLSHVAHEFTRDSHIEAILQALHSDPPPPKRLQKNYLLILGLYDKKSVGEEFVDRGDYMLREARDMALEGNSSDLFAYYEPKIIRDKYYSGKRQSNEGSEDGILSSI